MIVWLDGVGLLAPGLPDWAHGQRVLSGQAPYEAADTVLPVSALLPPAERRRMTDTVKLAMAVGAAAIEAAGVGLAETPSVFASSGGDGATITAILDILASAEREVSPTRFHNSVHNAPSGYWSIGTRSEAASTSLCACDESFAAGLIEAAAQSVSARCPILLVAYDLPYPPPLHAKRPILGTVGVALVLAAERGARSVARLDIKIARDRPETTLADPRLDRLRKGNPAARSLPLLAAVARGVEGQVAIPFVAGNVFSIAVQPVARGPS